ncbi:MAG: two-component sensor histidine kinase, partial [Umezawaea sp.]
MSSSRHPRSWSLRTRLLAEQIALLTLVCLIIGVVTMVALRDFQISKLDEQLRFAANRASEFRGEREPPPGFPKLNGRDPLDGPGQAPGTLSAVVRAGVVSEAQRLTPDRGDREQLTAGQSTPLVDVPADNKQHSATLGDLGEYRLIATRGPTGKVQITGL